VAFTILHTADWHLGHVLHDRTREEEHAAFLAFLLDLLDRERPDLLVVAGDVFDGANPPASAQRLLYGFLVEARARVTAAQIVVIGGNHDSSARLDAATPLAGALGVRLAGALPRGPEGRPDPEAAVVPLVDRNGREAAVLAAIPFLRPADLPPPEEGESPAARRIGTVLDAARARLPAGGSLLAAAHLHAAGGSVSEGSERRLVVGNLEAVPAAVFPPDLAYAALGHLHLAQPVGARENVRYAGSPLPLALDERAYPHQVVLAEVEGAACLRIRAVPVPRAVEVVRVPGAGHAGPEEVVGLLADLPALDPGLPAWKRPYLEVAVRLERPAPDLCARIEAALRGRSPRLARIALARAGPGAGRRPVATGLCELTPWDVFLRRWQAEGYAEPPSADVRTCFAVLETEAREAAS